MIPIRPESISDEWISNCLYEYVKRINTYIKNNIKFQPSGPYVCMPVGDISSFVTPLEKDLTNKLIEEVKPIYEKVGWTVWDDTQPGGSRYLTFSCKIWSKNESQN